MNKEWLEQLLGEEWKVTPAGGATGDAYIAHDGQQKLFLKRNSSPFLAVLSAEGIVPKLLWTRRLTNGDVISAQRWLPGRRLEPEDMGLERVAKLLKKIHSSEALVHMIRKLGKQPIHAKDLLEEVHSLLQKNVKENEVVQEGLHYLQQSLENMNYEHVAVCHCDVNHNNWLLSDENELFLIDWDGAVIADPALDVGMLLHWYIPREEWSNWLESYGLEMTESLLARMKWYVVAQCMLSIQWYTTKNKQAEAQYWLQYLTQLLASKSY
ncbi:phosphotransferase [Bacillus manliponensis]|uniref:Phosphotransferase n=1 Tax=Bacillus manliponensis TaxID=574376 RepID=A0A073JW02_9BACI|nr:phosphotransferase family protein [Bacillus manliponensis]KEK18430.1 phosphotransferase [Bacillus manliponensis]